jgi:outer membrane beta-barrel protein
MEIRLSSVLLTAVVLAAVPLSGCSWIRRDHWFHHGKREPTQVVAEEPQAEPSIIEPQVERRIVKTPKIKAKDFELGGYFGALSIQDFGTNPLYGVRGAYHVTEDIFLEGFVGRSKAGKTSLEDVFPAITVVSDSGRRFTYYDLDVGYNVLPGEVFLGRGRAFNTALYVTVGMGDVKFADKDQFALNFGVGTRILITDWLATHLDVRDHVFETDLTGRTKNVHNIEATLGFTAFF